MALFFVVSVYSSLFCFVVFLCYGLTFFGIWGELLWNLNWRTCTSREDLRLLLSDIQGSCQPRFTLSYNSQLMIFPTLQHSKYVMASLRIWIFKEDCSSFIFPYPKSIDSFSHWLFGGVLSFPLLAHLCIEVVAFITVSYMCRTLICLSLLYRWSFKPKFSRLSVQGSNQQFHNSLVSLD